MHRFIREQRGFVAVDFTRCAAREVFELYAHLAVLLHTRADVDAVLLKTGNEDPDLHYALRDVVCTLARVVGSALHVRVAVLGGSRALAELCPILRPGFRALGCDVRYFLLERQALAWLKARERQLGVLRVPACAA